MICTSSAWFEYRRPNPQARLRLFCFPYAGGGASLFRNWANALPQSVEVCAVQLPGREGRLNEEPFTSLEPLVQTLAEVLAPYLNMPFAFFGYSMGALIGFELARQLSAEAGLSPRHLFVAAHRAPQLPDRRVPLHRLPDAAFIQRLGSLNGTPVEILQNAEIMELLLPLLRADFTICETYACSTGSPLNCPISAFGGIDDDTVKREELLAWKAQTRDNFTLRMLPGDHFFVQRSRQALLEAVSQDMLQLVSHF